ncbi:hypothetical protein ACVIGB_000650 [Bradyrhizobium sp. USDA 4341]
MSTIPLILHPPIEAKTELAASYPRSGFQFEIPAHIHTQLLSLRLATEPDLIPPDPFAGLQI